MIPNIVEFNQHWIGQKIETPAVTRLVFSDVLKRLQTGLITFLVGPRRVGKSTLLKQSLKYILEKGQIKPSQTFFLNLSQIKQDRK